MNLANTKYIQNLIIFKKIIKLKSIYIIHN